MTDLATAPLWVRFARAVIRRLPGGRYRLARRLGRARRAPFIAQLPPEAGGLVFACHLSDAIAREACFTGRYEPLETALVSQLLAPGSTFVDVGANWGYFTLIAASRVGRSGRVVALEPDPRLFARLRENVALNALERVDAEALAASDAEALLELRGYDERGENWGVSTLATSAGTGPLFQVRARRLDDLLDERGVASVDLLKMDIEGAEEAALAGMEEGLARGRYRRLLVELHPELLRARSSSVGAVVARLERHGYRATWLDHSPAAQRRAAYARVVPVREFLLGEARSDLDAWPHVLWRAPGLEAP